MNKYILLLGWVMVLLIPTNVFAWQTTTLDSTGNVGYYTSIAIDSNDKIHISYYDTTNGDLKYATNASGNWVYTTLDSTGDVGRYSSIAIDSNNKVHISYRDWTNEDLKYATNVSGSWVITTIDNTEAVGWDTSIAIDNNNKVHISYLRASPSLKYITNTSGSWVMTVLDNSVSETSIATDNNNKVHISYRGGDYDLKYATNASGSWVYTILDSGGNVGYYSSIAIDSNNKIHISYYDTTMSNLKYITNTSGSWVTTIIDNVVSVTWCKSISIDNNNKVHISYYNGDLKYATNASGNWVYTTLDSTGDVGGYSSIAIDNNNKVHISYYDWTNYDLKYATNANNTVPTLAWTGETNYTSDGINPETGNATTTFIYRVKYTDLDNDAPASGYPKVHIKKGGMEISGSPFIMSAVDVGDTTYTDGKLYTYSKTLENGTDYTYYFEAQDSLNATATGTPTSAVDAPDITSASANAPTLFWTGEANYTNDGVNPETGNANTTFIYRVKYTDSDNDAPASGYPKVHIKKGGTEINGSPFIMTAVDVGDTTYTDGKLYTYSKILSAIGTDYTYYFEAKDSLNDTATGTPTTSASGPNVYNNTVNKDTDSTVYTDDGTDTCMEIPKGAVDTNVIVNITKDTSITDGIAYKFEMKDSSNGNVVHNFSKPVTITINYTITNGKITNTDIVEADAKTKLSMYYYDGAKWQQIASSIDTNKKTISSSTYHLSTYAVKSKVSYDGKVIVAPNPFTPNGDGVNDYAGFYFDNPNAEEIIIKIFNKEGMLVRTINGINPIWDGRDEAGETLDNGVYIYQFNLSGERKSGVIVLRKK